MAQVQTNRKGDSASQKESSVLYEHPLNEQVRTYLRLENLFDTQLHLQDLDDPNCHSAALHNLLQILDCLDRGDIKGELLKELEQQKDHFEQLQNNPYIDEFKLRKFLQQLEQLFTWISHYPGKFGSQLRKDRFIELIRNRMRIPGGSCSFDLPELHYFLHQDFNTRVVQFKSWFEHLKGLHQCLKIFLQLFRENAKFENLLAENGVFQYNFDKSLNPQLLRIKITTNCKSFPEISGSKHCFTIRFLESVNNEIISVHNDQTFQLAIC